MALQALQVQTSYTTLLLVPAAGASILDIASSAGSPAIEIAKAIPEAKLIATDLSSWAVGLARKRAQMEIVRNVSAHVADAQNLSAFNDNSFDAVTCTYGLMYFPHIRKALGEANRVLETGGLYAATVWASIGDLQLAQVLAPSLVPMLQWQTPACLIAQVPDRE